MSSSATLFVVLLAVNALICFLLSAVVAVAWRVGMPRNSTNSRFLLSVRLLPAGGSLFLAFTVVLPAFLIYEPFHESERLGPVPWILAALSLLALGDGIRRGFSALAAARALLRRYGPATRRAITGAHDFRIVDSSEPIVAAVGGWRPKLVAARRVINVCTQEEFNQIIAHEAAHISARDNLKLLLLTIVPDPLAWIPTGAELVQRWRTAVEFEADERATGDDARKRVALAAALIKVAKLATRGVPPLAALSMPIASDDVESRVRQLLAPSIGRSRNWSVWRLAACAMPIPFIAVPLYARIHQVIETLVTLGR
jgi:Zn-dependent protease with chaperone function